MRSTRSFILIVTSCFAAIAAQAQVDCTRPAYATKLACLVPFTTNAVGAAQISSTAGAFNGPIGVQISQLPVAASAPGATILTVHGNPQAFDNLGPVLIDRPDSVGRHKLVVGFSFQSFNFNHLDGIGLGSIPFAFGSQAYSSDGTFTGTNYFQQTLNTSIRYNQYVAVASFGLTRTTDVSVVVPFARVSAGSYNPTTTEYAVNAANTLTSVFKGIGYHGAGSASGISDILLNVKHVLWSGGDAGRTSIATGMAVRLPTGDALNYLGSGAYGFNLYGLASYKAKYSPHAKVAYQWNTNSILVGPPTTGVPGVPGTSTSNASGELPLPGGAQYGVGVDIGATPELTISGDILANEFVNSPYATVGTYTVPSSSVDQANPGACPTTQTVTPPISCTLPTIVEAQRTYTTVNLSVGLKLKPLRHQNFIFYANVLMQLNNVGLRSDPSPSVGASYRFK
jgi:hypothetical protein